MLHSDGVTTKVAQWVFGLLVLCGIVSAALAPRWAGAVLNPPPGGPILVVTSPDSTFGSYYAEILRNEGLNEFAVADISSVSTLTLASYDVVILAKANLSPAQVTMLSNWVGGGGNLIAMAPDAQLAPLLGLAPTGTTASEGYLQINTSVGPGTGLTGQTLQYHGNADRYTLNGAIGVATLYTSATTRTTNPAVSTRSVGAGTASAFAFDLAASVVYTRQGNPAWATQERDGSVPIRPNDKFFGRAAGDPQPDWIDPSKIAIPQADEQQRLLANLILHVNGTKKPLPRFWYFPHGSKAVVIMTGDDHANGGTAGRFDQFRASSPPGCSVADWECVRGTSYVYPDAPLSAAQASAYIAEGFEISLHVNPGCVDFDAASLQATYTSQLAAWQAKYAGLPAPATQRHHCNVWSDWSTAAQTQAAHGMRLDTTYYFWPPGWVANTPGLFTGSAMPMRFSTLNGNVIDVYQAPTQMSDDAGQSYPSTVDTLLDRAVGPLGYYGVFTVSAQTDLAASPEAAAVVASAQARGVPVVSARQMLDWLDARNASSFGSMLWSGRTLSFNLSAGAGATGLQTMLPLRFGGKQLRSLTRGGIAHSFTVSTIKGIEYAVFAGVGGAYVANYGEVGTTSTTTSLGPASGAPAASVGATVEALVSGWSPTTTPTNPSANDAGPVSLGVKFRTDVSGFITGVRFYKGAGNTGTHIGNLWTSAGQLLASATFTGETATGWQQANFASPVAVTANTVYVASYFAPAGHYAFDSNYFATSGVDNGVVHLLQNGVSGGNGVYVYGATSGFPSQTFQSTNYWVDVVFDTAVGPDTTPPTVTVTTPANDATGVATGSAISVTFNEAIDPASVSSSTIELRTAANAVIAASVVYNAGAQTATLTPTAALPGNTTLTATVRGGATDPRIKDVAGNAMAANLSWSFTTTSGSGPNCPCSAWPATAVPGTASANDGGAVEVGVKFRTDISGYITGIRFYKGANNTGTHTGNLWTSAGQLLASATFTNETASGWQQVNFGAPVAVTANTTYVASYFAPNGGYAGDNGFFANGGVNNSPVFLLQDGVSGGNGVFAYGASSVFPSQSFASTNYWVDVVFATVVAPDTTPPVVTATSPANLATGVAANGGVTALFNEPLDPSSVTSTTFELRNASNQVVSATVSYDVATRIARLQPVGLLPVSTTFTAKLRGGAVDPRIKDSAGNALAANVSWNFTTEAVSACANPTNTIVAENCLTGNPASEWDVSGAGDAGIQGYATQISINRGDTVSFKVNTNSANYRFDIYRLGFYGGMGARKIAAVTPTATLPQAQPNCLSDAATGLIDCGNWSVSGSWAVPANATSGIYLAKLVRADTGGASHIVFIVRNDAGASNLLFQTSDTTWQAYNDYGGNSLYSGAPAGRAYKVSYNRPFNTRGNQYSRAWLFGAEYPMVRWLEANGYDVSYLSGVDTERSAALLRSHRAFLSVGHDEYWSAGQRANVEAARDNGVHLAFFSGNQMFWKTRWENSIDGSATAYRTLVSYKETHANAKIDPSPTWTGTWRDPRFSPPADGGRPENAVSGTIFTVNCCGAASIQVPAATGLMRFWRNTSIASLAPGAVATLPAGMIGYEWDEDLDNGFRPPGLFRMSSTTVTGVSYIQDFGSNYAGGTATHALTTYKHASGALVFSSGTIRWSWGLDGTHDFDSATPGASTTPDVRVQQATVNLFADMNSQPGTLRPGLAAATASTDAVAPTSTITAPAAGASLMQNVSVVISGTASDAGGGIVGGVEVSFDSGASWRMATGSGTWTYTWTPTTLGAVTIRSRAVDDSGNLQSPGTSVSVTVGNGDTTPPTVVATAPASGATGVSTTPVVTATFSEPMNAASISASTFELRGPGSVLVLAGVGYNAATQVATLTPASALTVSTAYTVTVRGGTTDPRVKDVAGNALANNATWSFTTAAVADTTPPTITAQTPTSGATGVATTSAVTATFSEPIDAASVSMSSFELRGPGSVLVAASVGYNAATQVATLTPISALAASTAYSVTVRGGATDPRVRDVAGNALVANITWSFTTAGGTGSNCPCSGWGAAATPTNPSANDANAVELGVKFRTDVSGYVTGARFYKGTTNTGTHIGNLWTAAGQLLATAVFTGETAGGWQQVNFASPVAVTANTVYVVSYFAPNGRYAGDNNYFANSGVDNGVVHLLQNGVSGGNGVYAYGSASTFPTLSYLATNYWVDIVFNTTALTDTTPPTVTASSPLNSATSVGTGSAVSATFSEAIDAATISGATFELRDAGNVVVPAGVSYNAGTRTATLAPSATLPNNATLTATVRGGATDPRVKDVAGNALAANVSWSFTTVAAGDTTPPTVTARSPAIGATAVSRTADMTVTFSEAMNAATISTSNFELRDPANNLVAAAVSYNSMTRVATLNPTPTLAALTSYTVRVRGGATGVKDVAGNALVADVIWTFTTVTDTTAPTVSAIAPANGATGVSRSTAVSATFNEDMNAATINTTTFVLIRNSTGVQVTATLSYNATTRVATLTPSAALAASAVYTATVRGGTIDPRVKDGAGNALAANRVWSFTSGL